MGKFLSLYSSIIKSNKHSGRRFSNGLKLAAIFVVLTFSLEQLVYAAPEVMRPLDLSFFREKTPIKLRLPESVAVVEDHFLPSKSDSDMANEEKTLILIQDTHTNASAQWNIKKTLDAVLQDHDNIKLIFLEAGFGDESLHALKPLASMKDRERIGLSFLKKGKLQGSELFSLTEEHDVKLWG